MKREAEQMMWNCYNSQEDKEKLRKILSEGEYTPSKIEEIILSITEGFHPSPYCESNDNGGFKTPHTIQKILSGELKKNHTLHLVTSTE